MIIQLIIRIKKMKIMMMLKQRMIISHLIQMKLHTFHQVFQKMITSPLILVLDLTMNQLNKLKRRNINYKWINRKTMKIKIRKLKFRFKKTMPRNQSNQLDLIYSQIFRPRYKFKLIKKSFKNLIMKNKIQTRQMNLSNNKSMMQIKYQNLFNKSQSRIMKNRLLYKRPTVHQVYLQI